MILSCQGISKSFGEKVILEDASFHIEEREKAALIGNNGAGKTTLLRIIMEEIHSDAGQSGGLFRAVQIEDSTKSAPITGRTFSAGRNQHESILCVSTFQK